MLESVDLFSLLVIVLRLFGVIAAVLTIIFVHEFGHYIVGRWCGIGASAFSLGFGPELCGYTDKRGTRWRLALIPLGGYVKFIGDEDAASMPGAHDNKIMPANAFPVVGPWRRAATVFAGPFFNAIFTVVVLSFFFFLYGRQVTEPVVGTLLPNMPSVEAGLQSGDRFVKMAGDTVESFEDLQAYISLHSGDPIDFTIERQGRMLDMTITPLRDERDDGFGNKTRIGLIGVTPPLNPADGRTVDPAYVKRVHYSLLQAANEGLDQAVFIVTQTIHVVGRLITGREDRCQLSGPTKTGKIAWQISEFGFVSLLNFTAFLSISIGLVNLFPIPPLDGGHLVFYVAEGLMGRPVPQKIQAIIFRIGMFLVFAFMVFAVSNDYFPC